jgi:hypothetical protein
MVYARCRMDTYEEKSLSTIMRIVFKKRYTKDEAGATRWPAWLAGGEQPSRCGFVRDGRLYRLPLSVPYRLP